MNTANRHLPKNTHDDEYAPTLRDLAHRLQVSASSVKNLRRDGLRSDAQGYRVSEARQLLAIRSLRARSLARSPDALTLKTEKLQLEIDRARFELEVSKGEWVRRTKVIQAWRRAVIRTRDRFKHLGKGLAPLCAHRGPVEIESLITTRVYEILRELARSDDAPQPSELDSRRRTGTRDDAPAGITTRPAASSAHERRGSRALPPAPSGSPRRSPRGQQAGAHDGF